MKKPILTLAAVGSCLLLSWGMLKGWTSRNNDMTGQVKQCQHMTPRIFPDYDHCDISLGVMRNGVGSMSPTDVWVYVPHPDQYVILNEASKLSAIVNIKYNVARFRLYGEKETVFGVELVK